MLKDLFYKREWKWTPAGFGGFVYEHRAWFEIVGTLIMFGLMALLMIAWGLAFPGATN